MNYTDLQKVCRSNCVGENTQENVETEETEKEALLKKKTSELVNIRLPQYTVKIKEPLKIAFFSIFLRRRGVFRKSLKRT